MRTKGFDHRDLIFILDFLTTFKKESDFYGMNRGIAVWCVTSFRAKSTINDVASRLYRKNGIR